MVVPVLLGSNTVEAANQMTGHHLAASPLVGLVATVIHTAAYLAAMGILAWLVYRKLGLALLRKAWFNFDLIWGAALVAVPACSRSSICRDNEQTKEFVGAFFLKFGRPSRAPRNSRIKLQPCQEIAKRGVLPQSIESRVHLEGATPAFHRARSMPSPASRARGHCPR